MAYETSQRVWQTKKNKEAALPAPKTSRAGEYGRESVPQQWGSAGHGDVDMVDPTENVAGGKKVTFREPTDRPATRKRLGDVLRAESRPELLVKSILDQKLDVSIRDLIGVSPEVSKLIFRSSTWEEPGGEEAQKAQVRVSAAQEYREATRPIDGGAVVVGCPKVAVNIGGMEMVALVDSGAQINAMHLGLARKIGLPISTHGGISAVSYTGELSEFYGIVRNVEISIGEATIVTHILISKDQDPENPLILGRPFHKNTRLKMWDDEDGACYGRVQDMETGSEVEFQAAGVERAEEEGGGGQRSRGARSLNL
jgi:Aspartyl protease